MVLFQNMNHRRIYVVGIQLLLFCTISFSLLLYLLWTSNYSSIGLLHVSSSSRKPDTGLNPTHTPKVSNENDTDDEVAYQLSKLLSVDSDFPANLNKLEQENSLLHKYVHFRHLTPPSKEPYNLPGFSSSKYKNGFSNTIEKLFGSKRNGTFIEAGAYDGVAASNTLYFEKILGWRGLLVECNPMTVPFLKMKNRKAWIADVCLSQRNYPDVVDFSNPTEWRPSAKIGSPVDLKSWGVTTNWTQFKVTAIPLYAILSAINLTHIDFFSLDVEGAEFDVLKTIPWNNNVRITAILLEVNHFTPNVKMEIKKFLESKEYTLFEDYNSDQLYVHSSYNA